MTCHLPVNEWLVSLEIKMRCKPPSGCDKLVWSAGVWPATSKPTIIFVDMKCLEFIPIPKWLLQLAVWCWGVPGSNLCRQCYYFHNIDSLRRTLQRHFLSTQWNVQVVTCEKLVMQSCSSAAEWSVDWIRKDLLQKLPTSLVSICLLASTDLSSNLSVRFSIFPPLQFRP